MHTAHLPFPELGLIAGTRAALGAGLGLLLADRLTNEQRKELGWALVLIGVLSTVPLAADVLGRRLTPAE
jgi:multisubunit Na+/H+ antiporter MnhB subunit